MAAAGSSLPMLFEHMSHIHDLNTGQRAECPLASLLCMLSTRQTSCTHCINRSIVPMLCWLIPVFPSDVKEQCKPHWCNGKLIPLRHEQVPEQLQMQGESMKQFRSQCNKSHSTLFRWAGEVRAVVVPAATEDCPSDPCALSPLVVPVLHQHPDCLTWLHSRQTAQGSNHCHVCHA